MNWYRFSQTWQSFTPRQRELPFMYSPGLNRKAIPFVNRDVMDERDDHIDLNLYHVTTNLSGVLKSGKLMSRKELGVVGLGGGERNEASHLVSTTYDYNRALMIYHGIKDVCKIVNGLISASHIVKNMEYVSYNFWENDEVEDVLLEYIPKEIVESIFNGEKDIVEIDKFIKSPEQKYRFFQLLEEASVEEELSSDETYESSVVGFTGDFQSMKAINPSQVAILQLAARKGAWSDQVIYEKELRFKPTDLFVIRYFQP